MLNDDDKVKIIYTENGEDKIVSGLVHSVKSTELFYEINGQKIPYGEMHEITIRVYPKQVIL